MKRDYASRRFLLACAVLIVSTVLQWLGKLDSGGSAYMLIVVGVVGAFVTGDTMEKTSVHRTGYSQNRYYNDDAKDRT